MSKNNITGDTLVTKPQSKAFDEGFERIFGKKDVKKECEHEWELKDDSFSHEYGTEQIFYYYCDLCGESMPLKAGDCTYEGEDFP